MTSAAEETPSSSSSIYQKISPKTDPGKQIQKWTKLRLCDEIYLCLINVKEKDKEGFPKRKYEEQARQKIGWMALPPHSRAVFVILLRDLDLEIKEKLLEEDKASREEILQQVADLIFEQIDRRYYLLNARRFLKVRLER